MNRCLAEGRERFRRLLTRSEDGSRCEELGALLSAYCDGEASAEAGAEVREHLRACAGCRATMRAYRATPAAVAALAPTLPVSRSLLERAQELFLGLHSRLGGAGGADAGIAQAATAGGTRGAGMAALAKALAICAGTVGGAAACVAAGVTPPLGIDPQHTAEGRVERVSAYALEQAAPEAGSEPAPLPAEAAVSPAAAQTPPEAETQEPPPIPETTEAGAVEYAPPVEPAPPPTEPAVTSSGGAAGEFGP